MSQALDQWLQAFIQAGGGVAGTVHALEDGQLVLNSAHNIPPPVIQAVQQIPRGKGMAGLAWERDAVVDTCNLKTDESGDVRPGARAVDANAAVAIPVHDGSGAIRGVVGIAFMGEREISESEMARLRAAAEALPL